jgi:hypothetical protein
MKNIKVIKALGKPAIKSVNTPEAQHTEKVIPNPKNIPPTITPKLIGLIQRPKVVGSFPNNNPAVKTDDIKNINIKFLINFVEPVFIALLTLPANPAKDLVRAYPKPTPITSLKNNISP